MSRETEFFALLGQMDRDTFNRFIDAAIPLIQAVLNATASKGVKA